MMTYFEKTMLRLFCRSKTEARCLIREYRFCMAGGEVIENRLRGRLAFGYVIMLGLVRQPLLYVVMLPISLLLYGLTVVSFFK